MITVLEAARRLNLHKSTILDRIHNGILRAKKIKYYKFYYDIDEKSLIENMTMKIAGRRRNLKKYAKELRRNNTRKMDG